MVEDRPDMVEDRLDMVKDRRFLARLGCSQNPLVNKRSFSDISQLPPFDAALSGFTSQNSF